MKTFFDAPETFPGSAGTFLSLRELHDVSSPFLPLSFRALFHFHNTLSFALSLFTSLFSLVYLEYLLMFDFKVQSTSRPLLFS
jgi:hypothetical protein